MLEIVYEGLNARSEVYLSKESFCEMYPSWVSSKLCEFISFSMLAAQLYFIFYFTFYEYILFLQVGYPIKHEREVAEENFSVSNLNSRFSNIFSMNNLIPVFEIIFW